LTSNENPLHEDVSRMSAQPERPHPLRTIARWLSRLILKIFFRRIEVVGEHVLPTNQPTIFVLNHPNGLIDPLFILAFGPNNVSFMAKEPLFRTPLIRHFVAAFDCLPVYRTQDGADPKQNIKTIQAARDLLARGRSLALFPEGITHDEPQLQPLKTGAARIALSSRAMMAHAAAHKVGTDASSTLLPVGLYYPAKATFRSDAVVIYGARIEVPLVTIDDNAEPPRDAVSRLTARIDSALRALTINAADAQHIALAATAARVLDATAGVLQRDHSEPVHRRLLLMQQILARYSQISVSETPGLQALIARLRNYQSAVDSLGIDEVVAEQITLAQATRHVAGTVLGMTLALPFVLVGLLENYLPYRVIGHIACRASHGGEEIVSTLKVLAGALLFPLTWLAVSIVLFLNENWIWAIAHLLATPLCARAALWFADRFKITLAGVRIICLSWLRKDTHSQLIAERNALVAQLLAQSLPSDSGAQ
jgi:glycerol-3-phosphate O-acyltransferase/dihydroxyacetone phosphate acyltransferase